MQFSQIIGQTEIISKLTGMVERKRIPHALLLNGTEGGGNLATAFAFAQYVFCEERTNNDSCNKCRQCLRMRKLEHPDLHLVFPFALSKDQRVCDTLVVDFRKAFLNQPYLTLADWFNELGAENKQPVIPADESDQIIKSLVTQVLKANIKYLLFGCQKK